MHTDVRFYSKLKRKKGKKKNFPRFFNSYKDCSLLFLDLDHCVPWIIKHSKKPSAMNRACSSNWVMLWSPFTAPPHSIAVYFLYKERKYIFTTNATCRLKGNGCKTRAVLNSYSTALELSPEYPPSLANQQKRSLVLFLLLPQPACSPLNAQANWYLHLRTRKKLFLRK